MTEDEFYESISSTENKEDSNGSAENKEDSNGSAEDKEDSSESTENKDETHESIESIENSNPTQTTEPTKEPDPTSEPGPTNKPSENTGNVLVTIHAPLIFKDFDEIQTEELTSLIEKMSITRMFPVVMSWSMMKLVPTPTKKPSLSSVLSLVTSCSTLI